MDNGFPNLTDSFLAGQDIFYTQFNSVNFYVEDYEQEHFYFNIFKKLFSEIKFEKIFPLNGKSNVLNKSLENIGDNSKVYIVDLDFDDILGIKISQENLFYLKRYSIENYLLEKNSLYEIIRERNPKLKNREIDNLFRYEDNSKIWKSLLTELSCICIVIQKYSLGLKYFGLNPARDFNFNSTPPQTKNADIQNYFSEVENLLQERDGRYTLKAQIRSFKPFYKNIQDFISNVPGKYLLITVKHQLENLNLINQCTLESFCYKLSKDCDVTKLEYLRNEVSDYIN